MKKQITAIEWLEKIASKGFISPENFKQAKEMEKTQVIKAYNHCIKDRYKNALVDCGFKEKSERGYNTGEEYYNETFIKEL